MSLRTVRIAAALVAGVFLASAAEAKTSPDEFVQKASVAGKFEIDSSRLALQKSQSESVKAFAQQMIDDHTKVGQNLKDTLQSTHSQLQTEDTLDEKHQKLMNKLNDAHAGKDFDKEYISLQTKAHKQAVSLFKDYSKNGDDPALKKFAGDNLPTLQSHLDHIKQIKSSE